MRGQENSMALGGGRGGHAFRRKVFDYGHLFSTVCSPIWCASISPRAHTPTQMRNARTLLSFVTSRTAPYRTVPWGCHGFLVFRAFVGTRIMFVSERTIKIAYISAVQRPARGCVSLLWLIFNGLTKSLGTAGSA